MEKLYYVEEDDLIYYWSSAEYHKCFIMSLGYAIPRLTLVKIGLSFTLMYWSPGLKRDTCFQMF